ncbi:HAD family hydrolase [Streptomyces sp. NPDC059913]|uniref:HAD family hydrolase n=1 Tax=unclassified Streptomyces TaxID=2593676 RepID=UPI00365B9040
MSPPTAPGPFDAVLCDLDNVIRFYDTSALTRLEREAGLPQGTTEQVAYAPELDLPLLLGTITEEQWVDSVAARLTQRIPEGQARGLATALAGAPFRADGVVVGLLRRVREHLPLVLVTNATVRLEEDLTAMGLAGLAHHVVSSARVGVAKPDRRIYEIAALRAGARPDRCLFVDDRSENVRAAAALGMTGLHYRKPADLHGPLGYLLGICPGLSGAPGRGRQ